MQVQRILRVVLLTAFAGLMAACAQNRVPGDAQLPSDAKVTHRAVFIGKELHDTQGTISLYQSRAYPVIVFEPNFKFQGSTDAVVALGQDGYRANTALGALLRNNGRQAYAIPGDVPITKFNEVWLWNRREGKPLGLARLVPI
ncbi:MAG: DM13 domain-containing protein [Paracoccaceae bacterium]